MGMEKWMLALAVGFIVLTGGIYFFVVHNDSTEAAENSTVLSSLNDTLSANQPTNDTVEENENVSGDDFLDVQELHWEHMPLTYKIQDRAGCVGSPIEKLQEAFALIEESTDDLVVFDEVSVSEPDIEIFCYDREALFEEAGDGYRCETIGLEPSRESISPLKDGVIEEEDYLVSDRLLNSTENDTFFEVCYIDASEVGDGFDMSALREAEPEITDGKITGARMNIYNQGAPNVCLKIPSWEIHQTFHVLGIAHSPEPRFDIDYGWYAKDVDLFKDVMSPTLMCMYQREVDEKYFSCLKYVYLNSGQEGSCESVSFIER
jgi:hypothetical protein